MTQVNNNQPPTRQILIAYHADCIDGFTSAYITHTAVADRDTNIDLLPMKYDAESLSELADRLNKFEYLILYVVDFSVPVAFLENMSADHLTNVIILDHHKTAFEKYMYPGYKVEADSKEQIVLHGAEIILDNSKSGAGLCWHYFMDSRISVPMLVRYVQDYDLWRFTYGDRTKYVNKYLSNQTQSLNNWRSIHSAMEIPSPLASILDKGSRLQAVHDRAVKEVAMTAEPIELLGVTGLKAVCPKELTSDVGHALAKKCGTFGLMYEIPAAEDMLVTFSLRGCSSTHFDVSVLAKQLGGGGHVGAGGFTLDSTDPLTKELLYYGNN